jgi:hypothetical protein
VNQRGALGGLAGGTTITQVAASYPTIFTVRLVFSIASVGTDPEEADVIIWRSPQLTSLGVPIPPPPPPPPGGIIPLLTAANYTMLAKTEITNVPTSAITGNLGLSPAASSFITGFALSLDISGQFSTSAQVTGKVYAADYAAPTPALLTQAILDMEAAYTAGNALAPSVVNLNGGIIGGYTLPPGVYKFTTNVTIPTNLVLNGGPSASWVFQISGTLAQGNGVNVILTGGALPQNVYWVVAGGTTIGTTASAVGIYLDQTEVSMLSGATLDGQIYAQSAITLDANTVVPS